MVKLDFILKCKSVVAYVLNFVYLFAYFFISFFDYLLIFRMDNSLDTAQSKKLEKEESNKG